MPSVSWLSEIRPRVAIVSSNVGISTGDVLRCAETLQPVAGAWYSASRGSATGVLGAQVAAVCDAAAPPSGLFRGRVALSQRA